MFSEEDKDKDEHDADLHLAEYFRRTKIMESGHEEIGNDGHTPEPEKYRGNIGLQKHDKFRARPSNENENNEIRGGKKFRKNEEFPGVFFQIVGICLDAFVRFVLFVKFPSEPGIPKRFPHKVYENFPEDEGAKRDDDELVPSDTPVDDKVDRKENGEFSLNDNACREDHIGP